jgi:hypothetical protein
LIAIILGMKESKHKNNFPRQGQLWMGLVLFFILTFCWIHNLNEAAAQTAVPGATAAETAVSPFAYGANVAEWDIAKLDSMGFNWIKVFNGPGSRLPLNVLLRVDANASHINDVNGFANAIQSLAQTQKGYVDAYEIGNEPNLDATYGWGYGSTNVPPNAANYATLLCQAHGRIKTVDPDAVVVGDIAETCQCAGGFNHAAARF